MSERDPIQTRIRQAGERALAEAEERRKAAESLDPPPEQGGRKKGLEPVRYGDWEKKGLAIDF